MSGPYEAQIREIVEAVTIAERGSARVESTAGAVQTVAIANERGPYLGLGDVLYGTRYNVPRASTEAGEGDPQQFLASLRAANAIPHRFVAGAVAPREMTTSPFGHYVLLGRPVHNASTGRQVRFYFNVGAHGGAAFVREISTRFERGRIPFQAKVPVVPSGYARVDTGVLYLSDDDVGVAAEIVAAVYGVLRDVVRPDVPMFTLGLAAGLAFAESPPNGDSFGMHRCDLIAEGLVRAFEHGAAGVDERLGVVLERLREYGLDPGRLAFNPSSHYPYRFDAFAGEAA